MSEDFKEGFFKGISNNEYHAADWIGSTTLKTACKSMTQYKAQIDGDLEFKTTDSMNLGTAVHALVLEQENFDNEIAVLPELNLRTKDGKAAKLAFTEANIGKTIITDEQHMVALAMANSVLSHPEAEKILSCPGNAYENSGFYIDPITGLRCKYRPDTRNDLFIADLKTTKDASKAEFSKSIFNFGYHMSAAHYLEGDRALHDTKHYQFIFIAVENKFPYEVAIYTLDHESINLGYKERESGLAAIRKAQDTGEYPLLNDGLACDIGVPAWALNKKD